MKMLMIVLQSLLLVCKASGYEIQAHSSCTEDDCGSEIPGIYGETTTEGHNNATSRTSRTGKEDGSTSHVTDNEINDRHDIGPSDDNDLRSILKEEEFNDATQIVSKENEFETNSSQIEGKEYKVRGLSVKKENNASLDDIDDVSNETFSNGTSIVGTTTEMSLSRGKGTNSTRDDATHKDSFPGGKGGNSSGVNALKKYSDVCSCDLRVNECDVNCCCDEDCSSGMKQIFTECIDSAGRPRSVDCYASPLVFLNNERMKEEEVKNGLLCVVKNNFDRQLKFRGSQIIENATAFKRNMMRKKLFSFSQTRSGGLRLQRRAYRMGDLIWSIEGKYLKAFGIPSSNVNMQCSSTKYVRYLSQYSTTCIQSVPDNAKACEESAALGMQNYLRNVKIIKSPHLVKPSNESYDDKICGNGTCIGIAAYICAEGSSEISDCAESAVRSPVWDSNACRNVVTSVEYHIRHNGTNGIKEARAYFVLKNVSASGHALQLRFARRLSVKFRWASSPEESFARSGNPGYLVGKPVMAGRKVFYANETMSAKKEAIELATSPRRWLSVFGTGGGYCEPFERNPINFGQDVHRTCSISLDKFDFSKEKCADLQERVFDVLLGEDFADVKDNNFYNKFVASFGNAKVEDTSAWVRVIFDVSPAVSTRVVHANAVACRNVIAELFVDVAYANVGSFEKAQAKIVGVRFRLGSPRELTRRSGRSLKVSTFVHFIDMTNEATEEFAETPGFEAKLPHDFFYPFFSESSETARPNRLLILTALHVSIMLFELI